MLQLPILHNIEQYSNTRAESPSDLVESTEPIAAVQI